uniref:LigA n=1 Tax=Parastrongyloides trichosuri TaxID=131310 RepID=A0A0N4ZM82_PARTI
MRLHVEHGPLIFQQGLEALHERLLPRLVHRRDARIGELQADRGGRAHFGAIRQEGDPVGPLHPLRQRRVILIRPADQFLQAARAPGPLQGVDPVLDGQDRIGVDHHPVRQRPVKALLVGQAQHLGDRPLGPIAIQPRHRPRRQHHDADARLAAQRLLEAEGGHIQLVPRQVHRERRRGRVADGQPLAVVGDPVGVRHAHARGPAARPRAPSAPPAPASGDRARRSPRPDQSSHRPRPAPAARPASPTAPPRPRPYPSPGYRAAHSPRAGSAPPASASEHKRTAPLPPARGRRAPAGWSATPPATTPDAWPSDRRRTTGEQAWRQAWRSSASYPAWGGDLGSAQRPGV